MKPPGAIALRVIPIGVTDARQYVARWHRHLPACVGGLFALAVEDSDGWIRGVAIVGRPVARMLDDGATVEVTRVAVDGTPNACSMLYGAAWREASTRGYRRAVTYTRADESGTSLRAAGWTVTGHTTAQSWSRSTRPRAAHERIAKVRWQRGTLL